MSKEYVEEIGSQSNPYIHVHGGGTRRLKVYYSIPEQGVNPDTGVLLLIPGYGGHANSNVYKKMRRLFPDQYNLIVVQCDYFGWEFMQGLDNQQLISLVSLAGMNFSPQPDEFSILLPVNLQETIHNFNDMGPVQVMDLLNSLKLVLDKFEPNRSRIIAYGHSHGAYLALLANIMMPRFFSAIIDISGMLFPVYMEPSKMFRCLFYTLTSNDKVTGKQTNLTIGARFEYLVSKINQDIHMYDLVRWYEMRKNLARIITFQGSNDSMVPSQQKMNFLSKIDNTACVMVDEQKMDNKIFSSTEHGCGADYLELFKHVWETYDLAAEYECGILEDQDFDTDDFSYSIRMQDSILRLSVVPKAFLRGGSIEESDYKNSSMVFCP